MAWRSYAFDDLDAELLRHIIAQWIDEGFRTGDDPIVARAEWLAWRLLSERAREATIAPNHLSDEVVRASLR